MHCGAPESPATSEECPDHANAIKDSDEEHALGQDSWHQEREVALVAGWDGLYPAEDLSEYQQPQCQLDRPCKEFKGVALKFPELNIRQRQRVAYEGGDGRRLS